ncbi:HD-GYP domain-containing protein (c-di-GMP phosphodiesterase class II) [Anaerosolibacter carboniphilus]|uniref:HD-GYP domain-containing protein (C-di-GMP phosphodiesterase class II) n=1 Tax=Anaerosolibacter carboniphilus TaxID=1417629 RepID=A0A841KRH3_9FIRM|nr:HD-GYP domain-containing protein [Anaerosolibacter carboniphilus]MBB6215993.1 HD-GYP domain-containing protein (c-di-GMP phosphodiesterase class II) [Anaerosolibacter carboniphilus]
MIKSNDLKEGMILGRDILLESGTLLIPSKAVLTGKHIENIRKLDIPYICILDENRTNEIESKNFQWEKEYHKALLALQSVFHNAYIGNKLEMDKVQQAIDPLIKELSKDSTILFKIRKINVLDQYTLRHSINVGLLATITGKWLGFSLVKLKELAIAGFLHDIGKAMVPLEILNKPDKLTIEEFEKIREHATLGYNYLKNTPIISKNILDGILQHHDRMDGSGYPLKLKGNEINEYARIIAIVDTFDAIISQRPYKSRQSPFVAVEVLHNSLFHTLDPHICNVFLDNILQLYIGAAVKLNTNEVGEIVTINKHLPTRPLVRVDNKFIDLSENMNYQIVDLII